MNYKSGDLVKITGNSNYHHFTFGETVRLKEDRGGMNRTWKAEYLDKHDWRNVRESDMAPVKPATMPQKIIVTTDGKITLARLFDGKSMVKRAEAKCAPSDVFDFGVGAELAFNRLVYGTDYHPSEVALKPEPKQEPVKLYCVRADEGYLTKGKIYEMHLPGALVYDCCETASTYESLDALFRDYPAWEECLAPLVSRPAKVGEWVYVLDRETSRYEEKRIYKVFDTGSNSCVWFADDYKGNIRKENYLVLDGYTGDPV